MILPSRWEITTSSVSPRLAFDAEAFERLRAVVAQLLDALSSAHDRDGFGAKLRQAGELLEFSLQPHQEVKPKKAPRPTRIPGLARWQVLKIQRFLADNMHSHMGVSDLAALTGLSRSYFSRIFRQTFGDPPIVFIMRSTVKRAQSLMLQTDLPLAQIAGDSGFVDQAHLCRCFRRLVGNPPSAWRRAQASFPQGVIAVRASVGASERPLSPAVPIRACRPIGLGVQNHGV